MGINRTFYVTQGSLSVVIDGVFEPELVFADSDQGIRDFDAYLTENPEQPSQLLLDVIEEVFAKDGVPRLGPRDRAALFNRRAARKFPRTPYRVSMFAGSIDAKAGEHTVVHGAISNHELLDPWLAVINSHRVPLKGVYSVPLMGGEMLARLFRGKGPTTLLLTHHQGDKLRQVFLRDGRVMSARLSQCPPIDSGEYPEFTANEIQRGRRYLERTRLIGGMEELAVCLVAPADAGEAIAAATTGDSPTRYHMLDPATAAHKLGVPPAATDDRLEALYIAQASKRGSKHSYARPADRGYWIMHRLRHGIIGTAMAASIVCSVLAGAYFGDAWLVTRKAAIIEDQVTQLSSALRKDNEQYSPIQADSHEMKVAVDTGDYILDNRVPVPWVLSQLGQVLGRYPDVQVLEVEWAAGSPAAAAAPRARRGQPMPVSLPEINRVDAYLGGIVVEHDGDLREIFARIDELAAALEAGSEFSRVAVVQYPLDASPSAAISGEISRQSAGPGSRFRLHLVYNVPGRAVPVEEADNEAV